MTCYVYFAKFEDGTIKIGLSQHLGTRLATLQREMGLRGSFVGRLALHNRHEAQLVERALHRRLGADWIRGEFYADTPTVREELRRLLKDASAVNAIVAAVREAERLGRVQAAKPRPNVAVIAKLARDVVKRAPEAPDEELAQAVEAACRQHHVPHDAPSVANALRIATSFLRQGWQQSRTKPIVRVLQDLLAQQQPFTSYGDVAEALKTRCAQLKVPYDSTLVSAAIEQLELGGKRPIVAPAPPPPLAPVDVPVPRDLTRAEASRLYADVVGYFGARAFHAVPPRPRSRVTVDAATTPDIPDLESLLGGRR